MTDTGLQFVLDHRGELFPDAPVIFFGLAAPDEAIRRVGGGITGIRVGIAYAETLKLALALHPSTDRVFVVAKRPDNQTTESVRAEFRGFSDQREITYVAEATVPLLLSTVRSIPQGSLILYIWHAADGTRQRHVFGCGRAARGRCRESTGVRYQRSLHRDGRRRRRRARNAGDRDSHWRHGAARPRWHAGPGHSHRDRAGHAGHRLASGAAVAHRPFSSPARIANRISRALGVGALPPLHCRRRDGPAGAGRIDRRAGHSTNETEKGRTAGASKSRRPCTRVTIGSATSARGC